MLRIPRLLTKTARLKRQFSSATQAELLGKYPIGLSIHGFAIDAVQPIPEFSLVAVKLKHTKTGLEHLHLDSPTDNNNVFSVAFKTNPPDATGVPHILEHTTLCGSYKYPVRDPFFKMLNRSLSNFMNAMTGHDYTFYPFATTNRKDYDNLMSVYLSSVFEPILSHDDFMQEGWRLENSDVADKSSPLEFKGVVYNEMKGQCANSSYLYWIKFQESIYPALNNSGGDPAKIIDLQYEDLLEFHRSNYHPSNARTFTYGTFPLVEHLQKLNEFYTSFGKRSSKKVVKKHIFQTDTSKIIHDVEINGPVDAMSSKPQDEQYKSSITWYLGNPLEENMIYESFKWKVMNSLLLDGHNAPFYREFIETGFGEDFSPNCGFDQTTALLSFTLGLNNLSKSKVDEMGSRINDIFTNTVIPDLRKGVDSSFHQRVEAILHQLELSFKKHKPEFGLGMLNSIVPAWVNGMNPLDLLKVQQILNRFKKEYEEKGLKLFEDMIESTFLNPETPTFKFTMTPQTEYSENLVAAEEEALKDRVTLLTEADKEMIFERMTKLAEKQQTEDDVSVLPTLTLKDIPRKGDYYETSYSGLSGDDSKIQKRVTSTNGLIYASAVKDLAYMPEEYFKYLPLFSTCLTNLAGTELTSITELENKIQQLTGGISFSVSSKSDPFDISKPKLRLALSGMALQKNASHIYDLWSDILCNTKFTSDDDVVDKLYTLIKNLSQNQLNNISDRGHSYASSNSSLQLSSTKYISDILGGIKQVKFVMELNEKLEQGGKSYLKEELLPLLQKIQKLILNSHTDGGSEGLKYRLVGELQAMAENVKFIGQFESKLAAKHSQTNILESLAHSFKPVQSSKTIYDFPFQVGYASLAKLGAPYTSKDGAALQVLSQIMTFKHLHSVIRESNGAYGGGLNYDGLGGVMNFYSYRDPNAIKSAAAFAKSGDVANINIRDGKWTDKDLQEAKLAIFQSVDAPRNISSQGASAFYEGITDEMKQTRRENFLDVTLRDLEAVNEKYVRAAEHEAFTVLGDAKLLGGDESWQKISMQQ